jgi:hypothetical protein
LPAGCAKTLLAINNKTIMIMSLLNIIASLY